MLLTKSESKVVQTVLHRDMGVGSQMYSAGIRVLVCDIGILVVRIPLSARRSNNQFQGTATSPSMSAVLQALLVILP